MNWFNINVLFVLLTSQLAFVEPQRNWIKWFKSFKMIKVEMLSGRTLGAHKDVPSSFEILMDGLNYNVDPSILVDPTNHGPKEADIVYGKGMVLKGNFINPITFSVDVPVLKTQNNVCGFVLTSLTDNDSQLIFNLKALWKSDTRVGWDLIANPTNGEFEYNLRMRPNQNTRVIIFDSVPAMHFQLMMTTIPGKNVKFKFALLTTCKYKKTIEITDCGEKIDQNPRFAVLPFEVPISIKCPMDCIRNWPCWGFKVYSTDSPICWAANQNFGRWGDGTYTIYKIPAVIYFRSEVNPLLTHGVFCRASTTVYPGFTFDRKYYDFTKQEYRDNMGA